MCSLISSIVIYFLESIIRLDIRLVPAGEHAGLSSTWSQTHDRVSCDKHQSQQKSTGQRRAVGNMSGNRCKS